MKIILTGATGMVGEGVLLECLANPLVTEVLVIGRRDCGYMHPKLKQILLSDFDQIAVQAEHLKGYDACFYCAGIRPIAVSESTYYQVTYDTTIAFAKALHDINPNMVFNYITGRSTDSTEQCKKVWARINGKTENELMRIGFKSQYNFRPALLVPSKKQHSLNPLVRMFVHLWKYVQPKTTVSLREIGRAMIHTVTKGYHKPILEVEDILVLSD